MKSESSGGTALNQRAIEQHADAAELASRVAALPRRSSPSHGWLWWFCHASLWIVTISLLAAALLRVFYHDGTNLLTWINAFTSYVYLPAYACLLWSVWMRRWLLALVSFAVVGVHLAWMYPDFVRDRRFDLPATTTPIANESPTVRIFFANILATNHDFSALWHEIEHADADVVVLAECSRLSHQSFRQAPAMGAYVHSNGERRSQIGEVKVYSRLPIRSESQLWLAGRVVQKVDVGVGTQTLRVIGIHAPRPQTGYDYDEFWQSVAPMLTEEEGPVVIVGDFNATQHSRVYKQLQEGGLRSAHDDRGRGYATTWPNGRWLLPPIRIDQAFLSPNVECLRIQEGQGHGSDHKPLILDIALRSLTSEPQDVSRR